MIQSTIKSFTISVKKPTTINLSPHQPIPSVIIYIQSRLNLDSDFSNPLTRKSLGCIPNRSLKYLQNENTQIHINDYLKCKIHTKCKMQNLYKYEVKLVSWSKLLQHLHQNTTDFILERPTFVGKEMPCSN